MERRDPARRGAPGASPAPPDPPLARRRQHRLGADPRALAGQLTLSLALLLAPSLARADDFDELIAGRDAYINGEIPAAMEHLQRVIGLHAPTSRAVVLVTAARRYYAACLFAQRRVDEARDVLRQMLRDDPDAHIDQSQYDRRFVAFLEELYSAMQPELNQLRRERVLTQQQAEERREAREALMRDLLTHETQVERVPRELTFVPFGAGQFANGQTALGIVFLSVETLLTVTCVTTFAWQQAIRPASGQYYPDEIPQYNVDRALSYTNWASAGVLAAVMISGVIQANVAWQPVRRRTVVPRPMPPELQGARLMVSASPGPSPDGTGLGATLRLTF